MQAGGFPQMYLCSGLISQHRTDASLIPLPLRTRKSHHCCLATMYLFCKARYNPNPFSALPSDSNGLSSLQNLNATYCWHIIIRITDSFILCFISTFSTPSRGVRQNQIQTYTCYVRGLIEFLTQNEVSVIFW